VLLWPCRDYPYKSSPPAEIIIDEIVDDDLANNLIYHLQELVEEMMESFMLLVVEF